MNGCKVYQMPVNMANQHVSENTQNGVCVSKMFKSKKSEIQRAAAKATIFVIKLALSALTAWLTSLWAIPAAYAERGYYAVGGEWILIIGTFGITYWAITSGIRHMVRNASGEAVKCRHATDAGRKSGLSNVPVKRL